MFLIKQTQLRQLAESGISDFVTQLLPLIEDQYPEEVLLESSIAVRKRLTNLVQKAFKYSLVSEQHVSMFIIFCMELGDDFDEQPAYQSIVDALSNPAYKPQERIEYTGKLIFNERPIPYNSF